MALSSHTIRTNLGATVAVKNYARHRAIKAFCTECMGWESHPKDCTSTHCPLYPFRGKIRAAIQR